MQYRFCAVISTYDCRSYQRGIKLTRMKIIETTPFLAPQIKLTCYDTRQNMKVVFNAARTRLIYELEGVSGRLQLRMVKEGLYRDEVVIEKSGESDD